jgi:transcriptional regulator with XRE-family HTH domain
MEKILVLKYLKYKPKILEHLCRVKGMDKPPYISNIARNVEMLRKAREWSQEDLGRKAGLSQKVISNLENAPKLGISPTLHTVTAVADALDVSIFILMTDISEKRWSRANPDETQVLSRLINDYIALPPGGRQTVDRVLDLELRAN